MTILNCISNVNENLNCLSTLSSHTIILPSSKIISDLGMNFFPCFIDAQNDESFEGFIDRCALYHTLGTRPCKLDATQQDLTYRLEGQDIPMKSRLVLILR